MFQEKCNIRAVYKIAEEDIKITVRGLSYVCKNSEDLRALILQFSCNMRA
jgi:hypothetical protein